MKWLPLLLALYVLALALMSCTDSTSSDCGGEYQELMADAERENHPEHSHTGESMDNCSPLCTCHCCHVHVTLQDPFQRPNLMDLPYAIPSYYISLKDIPYFDFFVPPRI